MKRNIYVVYDTLALDIVGPLMMYAHHAPAVRVFTDELANPQSLGRHANDLQLLCLGSVDTDNHGTATLHNDQAQIILTGSAWLASQPKAET